MKTSILLLGAIVCCIGCQSKTPLRCQPTPPLPALPRIWHTQQGQAVSDTNVFSKVRLTWERSPSPSVVSHRIYIGGSSRTYTNHASFGNVTNATITNLIVGATYYFTATALDASGLESDYSNETLATVQPPRQDVVLSIESAGSPDGPFTKEWEVLLQNLLPFRYFRLGITNR